ncbi:MAG: acyl-CoA dehydrogenase [Rhodospirillaceae bacterium]|nr:acyl-CoA dehydrogenase [Rhodospirillaceae bacterium]MAX62371.1 acyl-CoA dehydrogenase [Rhodospirillaceae bacterium]MBB56240.1 acyl-CoA dehydrogenase [Rhodospirillaceae bacterium]|tara:strand:- start:38407 stop:39567 length:1161 start_codon:yes stop_codon:yes gene_type:complete
MALDADTFRQITETIDRFVRDRLIPAEAQVDEDNAIPTDIISEMRDLGLFGLSIPEEYGGLGLTMSEEVELTFRLGRASPAFRSLIGTNNGIGSQGILLDGTDQQKQKWLPRLASGEIIGSFALTEPDSGSDAASISLSAQPDGPDFILNGTKRYITNAPIAGLFTVMARSDSTLQGAKGITAFLVEADTPGLSVGPPDRKMGQRGAKTADVIFQDCRVPASAIIGGIAGRGFATAMKVLDRGRLHISAVCVGAAERLLNDALTFAMTRRQFGAPIAEFQLIQAMLADSRTELYAAKSMVTDAARRRDAGEAVSLEASCCKLFCSEMVGRIADRAVQIHGGAGYMSDYPVERFYRDVRLFRLYEGTSQIQQLVIARNMIRKHQDEL